MPFYLNLFIIFVFMTLQIWYFCNSTLTVQHNGNGQLNLGGLRLLDQYTAVCVLTLSTTSRGHSATRHSDWALLVSLDEAAGVDLVLLVSCRNGLMRHGFAKHQNREERWHARTAPTRNVYHLFFFCKVMFRTSDEPLWKTPSLKKKLKMAFAPGFTGLIHNSWLLFICSSPARELNTLHI